MEKDNLPVLPDETTALPPAVPSGYPWQLAIPQQMEEGIHLLDYWKIVVKRKWIILLCFVVTVVTAYFWTRRQVPLYQAQATMEIDFDNTNILPYRDFIGRNAPSLQFEYIQTQCAILQSKSLASRVARALRLDRDPMFQGRRSAAARPGPPEAPGTVDTPDPGDDLTIPSDPGPSPEEEFSPWAGIVRGGLSVQPVKESQLIQIMYISPKPELACRIVNTVADEYIQMNFEARFLATQQAADFLKKQLTQLKAKLEKSEEYLIQYARENDIMVIGEKQDVVLQKLSELNAALTEAETERVRKESIYRTLKAIPDPYREFPSFLKTPLIDDLDKRISSLRQDYARQSAKFGPDWPGMKEVSNQVQETEQQLEQAKRAAIGSIVTDYDAAQKREKMLRQMLSDQTALANKLRASKIQYNILQREVETTKNIYEGMLVRLKEATVAAGLRSSNVRIVDRAEVPRAPFKPDLSRSLMLSLIVGLLIGIGMAFFIEYLDNTVKTPDQVEQITALPSLGLIPSTESAKTLPAPRKSSGLLPAILPDGAAEAGNPIELVVHNAPSSSMAEAFRSLRTSILLSSSGSPPQVVLFTSPRPQEGKTTASANTAISFAQAGKRVALLDLDMRKPRQHHLFGLDNEVGLSSFLAGSADLSSLIRPTRIKNLYVLTSGPIPPNPAELLSCVRLKQALELLREFFDQVIIDSPPLLSVADARILSRMTDGVVLIIRSGETPKQVLRQAQKNLLMINAKILGILVNAADLRSADYYYHSKYYYYSYYQDETGKRKRKR